MWGEEPLRKDTMPTQQRVLSKSRSHSLVGVVDPNVKANDDLAQETP